MSQTALPSASPANNLFRRVSFQIAFATLAMTSQACNPDQPIDLTVATKQAQILALTEPDSLVKAALAGVRVRGEQDQMLKVESHLPGFGGFFVDEADRMVVYLKAASQTPAPFVRHVLSAEYGNRREERVREVMSHLSETRIIDGQFSLSELIAAENRISYSSLPIPGFVGVGVSLKNNRVHVGFLDQAHFQDGMDAVLALGVPPGITVPEVWGQPFVTGTFGNAWRPVGAAIKIEIANRTYSSIAEIQSMGFVVTDAAGHTYIMTAAHGPNSFHGQNGATGDTIFQNSVTNPFNPGPIGTIAVNPPWQSANCGTDPVTHLPFDYCPTADVALISPAAGLTAVRKVATSMYEGLNGDRGQQEINNFYPVREVVTPEWVKDTPNGVHKSGMWTGTTTGVIDETVSVLVDPSMKWGLGGSQTKDVIYRGVTRIAHIGWGKGDSGAPVFAGNGVNGPNGTPYYVLGLIVGGTGSLEPTGYYCTSGMDCAVYFSPWSQIEIQLGVGHLNPATSQPAGPPDPPPYSVTINGSYEVQVGCPATWIAGAQGATAPYAYTWSINGTPYDTGGGDQLDFTPTSTGTLNVEATSSDSNSLSSTGWLTVNVTSGNCS